MLNAIIRFSLHQRLLVLALALACCALGGWQAMRLPVDVFPDLNRPRVTVITEAPGMAPEEVESLITFRLETAFSGASGVEAVRSSSAVGLSVIYVEFSWGTDINTDRQIVMERLSTVMENLPAGVRPQIAPVSSILGQIMMAGLWSKDGTTSPRELRTLADWVVRQRLLTVPGVSQVFVMGGERKQFQVLVDPAALARFDVTLEQVEKTVAASNQNATGGYLEGQGPYEFLVRGLGRISSVEELRDSVVVAREGRSITLADVATVQEGPQLKRGDGEAFALKPGSQGEFSGGPAVILTINKQPGSDTRIVTTKVAQALEGLRTSLPKDVEVHTDLYQQKKFIDLAIHNVVEALRDGAILVVIVLVLFLMNVRVTIISLTAIPLSLLMSALIFAALGMGINTMTLGGLAVAIGELVDDAIVDVENVFRRLRENAASPNPRPSLLIVYRASAEVRNSIVFSTAIVCLVFLPVYALGGVEGRLFAPLATAYIVSLLCSLLVSLTVTPALASLLLGDGGSAHAEKDGLLLRLLKWVASGVIRTSMRAAWLVILLSLAGVVAAGVLLTRLDRDFLPPFNEGVVQVNAIMPPGTSLSESQAVARQVEREILAVKGVRTLVRRTGRAELDEHAMGVNVTEMIVSFDPNSGRSREAILDDVRHRASIVPGVVTAAEQPLAHSISHMLSGVSAQIAIKLYGDDLETLRREAGAMQRAIQGVRGVVDLQLEQQTIIPQLRIEFDGAALKRYGLQRATVTELVETAMNGRVVSTVLQGQRAFDLIVRMQDDVRLDRSKLERLAVPLPRGGAIALSSVARIYDAGGPNTVERDNARRRIVLQCNVSKRGLVDVVEEIKAKLAPLEAKLPTGYFVQYGGQFESQQSATLVLGGLFIAVLIGMFLILNTLFGSATLAAQEMVSLPTAFIGAVLALYLTHQTLTVAAMVGFISLCGIAVRNGILLITHYQHLATHEGHALDESLILRGSLERLAPVLMTALTSGIGLFPLALAAGEPGKEVLYPVATVIVGGLITSTALEFVLRPALFRLFGLGALAKRLSGDSSQVELVDEPHAEPLGVKV